MHHSKRAKNIKLPTNKGGSWRVKHSKTPYSFIFSSFISDSSTGGQSHHIRLIPTNKLMRIKPENSISRHHY